MHPIRALCFLWFVSNILIRKIASTGRKQSVSLPNGYQHQRRAFSKTEYVTDQLRQGIVWRVRKALTNSHNFSNRTFPVATVTQRRIPHKIFPNVIGLFPLVFFSWLVNGQVENFKSYLSSRVENGEVGPVLESSGPCETKFPKLWIAVNTPWW